MATVKASPCLYVPAHHETTVYWAMTTLMARRLIKPG
jgi:hypothetical protein